MSGNFRGASTLKLTNFQKMLLRLNIIIYLKKNEIIVLGKLTGIFFF